MFGFHLFFFRHYDSSLNQVANLQCSTVSLLLFHCFFFLRFKIHDDIREHAGLSCGLVLDMIRSMSWSRWLRLHRNSFGFGEKRCSRHMSLLFCTCPKSVIGLNQFIQSSPTQQHGISCSECFRRVRHFLAVVNRA